MTYNRIIGKINTPGITSGDGKTYPSGAHDFNPVHVAQSSIAL
jgi:hypothetical protein